ncbi:MAG: hypothetical protein ACYC7D_04615 [Nitrososphaerales archaeon]
MKRNLVIGIVVIAAGALIVILAATFLSIEKACYELCPLVNGAPFCQPCPKSFNIPLGIGGILLGGAGGIIIGWNRLSGAKS